MTDKEKAFLGACGECPSYEMKDSRITMIPWCSEFDEMLTFGSESIKQHKKCTKQPSGIDKDSL